MAQWSKTDEEISRVSPSVSLSMPPGRICRISEKYLAKTCIDSQKITITCSGDVQKNVQDSEVKKQLYFSKIGLKI